jgi:superfamily II DNA or RNA helicase
MGWRNYSKQEREAIAADYEKSAQNATNMAKRLEAKGATVAAGTYQRSAEERSQIAAAAREGSDALNEYFNG